MFRQLYLSNMETTLGIGSRVEHPHFGKGKVVDVSSEVYTIWFKSQDGVKKINKDFDLRVIEATEGSAGAASELAIADIEQAIENILDRRLHEMQLVPMANKWNNGSMVLKPADDSLQPKEFPIETFFHKIVMV